jgi:hypothetical protein
MSPFETDHNKWPITLTVITLNKGHSKILVVKWAWTCYCYHSVNGILLALSQNDHILNCNPCIAICSYKM